MKCAVHNRVRVILLAALVAAGAGLSASADATIYRDCFTTVDYGEFKHVACTAPGLGDIDFAIDSYNANRWQVTLHFGGGNDSRIVVAPPGEHRLSDNVFTNTLPYVTGTAQPFVFEFYNWYKIGTSGKTWYGYVSLGLDENAQLQILESAVTDSQGALVVTGNAFVSVDFKVVDHGDWLELAKSCIDSRTAGWIRIPSTIDGKPVKAISRYAFANCELLTKIVIPDGIESIGECAFINCNAISELAIPDSVTNVGRQAVCQCTALRDLTIGSGLESIGYTSFVGTGMENLTISVGTTNIESYAFADNTSLQSVSIPVSMKRIKSHAFDRCTSLSTIAVPYATIVEDGAFPQGCTITRYGPFFSMFGNMPDPDEDTKAAFMRTLDWHDYSGKCELRIADAREYDSGDPSESTSPLACAHLGISPIGIDFRDGTDVMTAYYRMPTVEFVGIDPANRTITGRVIPAEGTQIISAPLKRAFGFYRIWQDYDGVMRNGDDWGTWLEQGINGFSFDSSNYITSNGLFRITYSVDVLEEKAPQPAHLFRIQLKDRKAGLW